MICEKCKEEHEALVREAFLEGEIHGILTARNDSAALDRIRGLQEKLTELRRKV